MTDSNQIKLGIIGLGNITQLNHLPLLSKNKEVTISAVADINRNTLKNISSKFGIEKSFLDYREMIKMVDMDAVIIATPTISHKVIAIDCIEAGLNIFVEKPIAKSREEAKVISAAAAKHKVLAMVGMNMRYRPDVMMLKSIVNSGDLGDPYLVKAHWHRPQSSAGKWFSNKEEAGGGVILDLGIAILDLSLWMLNFPEIISVSTANHFINNKVLEDSSISFIRAVPNSVISMETSWVHSSNEDSFIFEIYCSKGKASLNPFKITKIIDGQTVELTPFKQENSRKLYEKSFVNELNHFIGAIIGRNPVLSSAVEAVSRMGVIEGMYKSASAKSEIGYK